MEVKQGHAGEAVPAHQVSGGLRWAPPQAGTSVTLTATPLPDVIEAREGRLRWDISIEPGRCWAVDLSLDTVVPTAAIPVAPLRSSWAHLRVEADDYRLAALVSRSLQD